MSFSGMDAVSGAAKTNVATFFFTLKPWGERKAPGDSSFDLARKAVRHGLGLEQGSFIAFNPPPISGMSNTGGFEMWLQDRNGRGSVELSDVAQKLAEAANKRPELQGVSTSFTVNAPQLLSSLTARGPHPRRERVRCLPDDAGDVRFLLHQRLQPLRADVPRLHAVGKGLPRAAGRSGGSVRPQQAGRDDPPDGLINVKPTSGPQTVERFNNFQAAKFMATRPRATVPGRL